jgi:hypothetical protein
MERLILFDNQRPTTTFSSAFSFWFLLSASLNLLAYPANDLKGALQKSNFVPVLFI